MQWLRIHRDTCPGREIAAWASIQSLVRLLRHSGLISCFSDGPDNNYNIVVGR